MKRRYVASGELLAVGPGGLQRSAEGFFWMLGDDPVRANARHREQADIAIVTVRGTPLEGAPGEGVGLAVVYLFADGTTAPVAAETTTVSPAFGAMIFLRPYQAVTPGIPKALR